MRGGGNGMIDLGQLRWGRFVILPLSLLLAWLFMGAVTGSRGERDAIGFAWHVEASATLVAGSRP